MAVLPPPTATATTSRQAFPKFTSTRVQSILPFFIHLHRSFPPSSTNPNARLRLCHAALSPQPPPQSDPPPEQDPARTKGLAASFSRFQDSVQIFLAVLFWMSLFFWACVSDGRNNNSGRPSKGSRLRR